MTAACQPTRSSSSARAARSTPPRRRSAWAAGCRRFPACGEPRLLQRRLTYQPEPVPIDYDTQVAPRPLVRGDPSRKAKKVASSPPTTPPPPTPSRRPEGHVARGRRGVPACDQQYNLGRRGRLEALRPNAEGLRRRGRHLHTASVNPSLREPARGRPTSSTTTPSWLQRRANFYDAAVRGLEHERMGRQRVRPVQQRAVRARDHSPATQQYVSVVKGAGGDISGLGVKRGLGLPAVGHRRRELRQFTSPASVRSTSWARSSLGRRRHVGPRRRRRQHAVGVRGGAPTPGHRLRPGGAEDGRELDCDPRTSRR